MWVSERSAQGWTAYGSPTDEVAKLIRKAVDEHPKVLPQPEPIVEFQEFGNNALVFEVYFWTEVETMMDLRTIRSDIRFRIDQLFREAAIIIAFPQRDVHLDTRSPLEVRLLSAKSEGNGPEPRTPTSPTPTEPAS